MPKESLEVTIDGFTGPLDLLCHLVESRQMQASKIRVTQLVRIYGAWLAKTGKVSMDTLAEFFFMVAGLLLQKTLALLPDAAPVLDDDEYGMEDPTVDEADLIERMARYRPYRAATSWLEERKKIRERRFRRIVQDDDASAGEPVYDIHDLYFLSRTWWGLFERYRRGRKRAVLSSEFEDADEEWNGLPEVLPEEAQIQSRIAELEEKLTPGDALSFNVLWRTAPSVRMLVVTLLAVLEMCRMNKVYIEQEGLFADVRIYAKR